MIDGFLNIHSQHQGYLWRVEILTVVTLYETKRQLLFFRIILHIPNNNGTTCIISGFSQSLNNQEFLSHLTDNSKDDQLNYQNLNHCDKQLFGSTDYFK